SGRTDIYSRATTGGTPRDLIGPRAYPTPDANGAAAVGDVDGDLLPELVVGGRAAKALTIMHEDELLGLVAAPSQAVSGTPDFIAIGRFVEPTVGLELDGPRPQIAFVDAAAGKLWIYENILLDTLTRIAGPEADGSYALGAVGTGLAAGDFAGGELQDLAVTTQTELLLFTQSATTSQIEETAAVAVAGLRGPSIGDAHANAGTEIAVCDTAAGDSRVRVYDATASLVTSYPLTETPWATAIGDALSGIAGNEIAVAARATGSSYLYVIPQTGAIQPYSTAVAGSNSGSVLIADVDGDATNETLVGNAGRWDAVAGMTAPFVDVYRPSGGTALGAIPTALHGGGSQLAGTAPALLTADFGPVLPSRHPVDVVASHVSTETGTYPRHVTCSDCHSSHEASSGIAASAPLITGNMRGAWGTAVANSAAGTYTPAPADRAVRQYEVCFKCHATTANGRTDIASLVNTRNASVHAIEDASADAVGLAGSYVGSWGNGSILYCSDCHGNSAGSLEPTGTHRSGEAPLLRAPVLGLTVNSTDLLCYDCHNIDTYFTGASPATSRFYAAAAVTQSLHTRHSGAAPDMGLACSACHVSHGSATEPHLLRSDIGYTHGATPPPLGSCANDCHAARAYAGP
ncbi:MAG: hypothetical protein Q7W16_04635, partial [Coriobacteriia bacterium]|nr:hypothetical protein [Coriobacteriia bacterium]